MNSKKQVAALVLASLSFSAYANDQVTLNSTEKQSVLLSQEWATGKTIPTKPGLAQDGSVRFVFGSHQQTVVCAVFQVCDIGLEPGEQINHLNVGDTIRWDIQPSVTGSGASLRYHVIVKPRDTDLETTMVISTDRRAYHLRLKSTKKDYMAAISFVYPEDLQVQLKKLAAQRETSIKREILPASGENILDLDFNYTVSGSSRWKPTRVYNNGRQTFIQMPKAISQDDAPALLILKNDGDTALVNYQLIGDKYLVDSVFQKAVLISGVGRSQEKVTITKTGN